MNHFFASLEGEFDDMSERQLRSLKIRILQLIDDIKQDGQVSKVSEYAQQLSAHLSSVTTPKQIESTESNDALVNFSKLYSDSTSDNLNISFFYTER